MRPARIFRTAGFRLAAIYAGLFGFSVLVLFGVIYWITSEALHQQLASGVEAEATALAEDYRNGGLSQVADAINKRRASGRHPTTSYLLLDAAGRTVAGHLPAPSPRLGWQELPLSQDDERSDDESDQDEEHRMLGLGMALPDGALLMVGEDTYQIVEIEEAIARAFAWALCVTVLLAAGGGIILSVGFLRRVDAINQTSLAIIDGRLDERVPTRGTGDEFDRLALNLNEMLDRVHALMESLRQVSNDIAHDLRTPLTRLRQRLEGARLKARRIEDYEAVIDRAITDTDAILQIFAALLRIAQIEAGTRKLAFSVVDLSSVFQSLSETYGAVAEDRGQTLSAMIEPGIRLRGDRELLTQMLANLVENAIRHTPEGTQIELSLENTQDGAVGSVADNGPGIPAEDRENVFRRFFRLERSRSTAGSGLGLSLVAAVAELHDIAITLTDNKPGLKVVIDFSPRMDRPRRSEPPRTQTRVGG